MYRTRCSNKRNTKRTLERKFKDCIKVACTDIETGYRTSGIIFSTGKMAVGDDCWRLANPADTCDFPFKFYKNSLEVEKKYRISYPERTIFFDEREKEAEKNDVS